MDFNFIGIWLFTMFSVINITVWLMIFLERERIIAVWSACLEAHLTITGW